jgi:hypothetical protein
MGLLLKKRGEPQPTWWNMDVFKGYRALEKKHLGNSFVDVAAKLLGLESCPVGFEDGHWEGAGETGNVFPWECGN